MFRAVGMNPPGLSTICSHTRFQAASDKELFWHALVTFPEFIVADEPDRDGGCFGRAVLLDLMMKMKEEFDLTYLFITHDLATAKYVCNRIAILYLGKLCEMGPLNEVYGNSAHPYTHALLEAVPVPDPSLRRTEAMPAGEIPNAINPTFGLPFPSSLSTGYSDMFGGRTVMAGNPVRSTS